MNRLIKLGDSFSQMVNAVLLDGSPNESLSGRAYRTKSRWEKWINRLLWFDKDHCRVSYENDVSYAAKLLAQHKEFGK